MSTIAPLVGQNNLGRIKEKPVKNIKILQRAALGNISNATAINQEKTKVKKASELIGVETNKKEDFVEIVEEIVVEEVVAEEVIVEEESSEDSEVEEVSDEMNNMRIQRQGVGIINIDRDDVLNPQLMAEYVKDIYEYLRGLEVHYTIRPGVFSQHTEVTSKMRNILVDWLVSVHQRFHLLQETLFLAVSILDRYLQDNHVERQNLQLAGVVALWIAAKYEEMYSPELVDFVYVTDNAYTKRDLRIMECTMLRALDFKLGGPLPIHFLRRFSKAGQVSGEVHNLAKYLIELSLTEPELVHYLPSKLSAAALLISLRIQDNSPWTDVLQHYSGYTEKGLRGVLCKLAMLIIHSGSNKLVAIKSKYASSKYLRISRSDRLAASPYVLALLGN